MIQVSPPTHCPLQATHRGRIMPRRCLLTPRPLQQVVEDPLPLPGAADASPEFCDFVAQCMAKDPHRRPSAEALLSHPFILKVLPH
jgi:serine/threonine protein kinase